MTQANTPAAAPLSEAEDKQWASFAHLGGILWILPPLIIWLIFKDRGRFTNEEGKESLNFQITVGLASLALTIVSSILTAVTFGLFGIVAPLLYLALAIFVIVYCILAFLKAKDGIPYRYPVALRLIK